LPLVVILPECLALMQHQVSLFQEPTSYYRVTRVFAVRQHVAHRGKAPGVIGHVQLLPELDAMLVAVFAERDRIGKACLGDSQIFWRSKFNEAQVRSTGLLHKLPRVGERAHLLEQPLIIVQIEPAPKRLCPSFGFPRDHVGEFERRMTVEYLLPVLKREAAFQCHVIYVEAAYTRRALRGVEPCTYNAAHSAS